MGRVGRIGHGELKGWSWLLSRKALLKASKHLKEICGQCSLLYPSAAPCVLSACLVSLEPDSTLRLMADQFTPDERFSQASVNCQLSTPQDVTCTHILVFPTSATTQVCSFTANKLLSFACGRLALYVAVKNITLQAYYSICKINIKYSSMSIFLDFPNLITPSTRIPYVKG